MKLKSIFFISFILVSTVFSLINNNEVKALAVDRTCTKVETVFARGSGSSLNDERGEALRFYDQIDYHLKDTPSLVQTKYELGTESYGGNKYPAVAVNDLLYQTALGAFVSGGSSFAYGDSVKQGVGELQSYLSQRYTKCKSANTFYVLGGYSQGAQVVGQALPGIAKEIRDRIVYVGLFGDPKLHLPEGEGWNPPACQGKGFSPWRRAASNCDLDNGSLGARKPYLPDDMKTKTGLWCYQKDSICDFGAYGQMEGHGEYKNKGGAIDDAAREAAAKIGKATTTTVDTTRPHGGTVGIDTVFVIDTTGSMNGILDQVKTFARTSADKIKANNGRVALVAYKDYGDNYSSFIFSNFNDTYETFLSALNNLQVGGGGDTPEATLHALMTAMNGLSWKNGATKAAVVLTDASFHNPDTVDGSTVESVAKRSLEIDPVNVYPVVPSNLVSTYQELATKTSGQVIDSSGDTTTALDTAITKIQNRPIPILKNLEYKAKPGQEITFDASDSYVNDATITKYEWDFNGDGVFETTTMTPTANFTYSSSFFGNMQVRLTAGNNTWANASAAVTISDTPPPQLVPANNLTATINSTSGNKSTVTISWKSTKQPLKWLIKVNDIAVGNIEGDRTSIQITDIDRTEDVYIGVASATTEGISDYVSTTVPAAKSNPTTPPILSTCNQSNILVRIICKAIAIVTVVVQGVLYYILPWSV